MPERSMVPENSWVPEPGLTPAGLRHPLVAKRGVRVVARVELGDERALAVVVARVLEDHREAALGGGDHVEAVDVL